MIGTAGVSFLFPVKAGWGSFLFLKKNISATAIRMTMTDTVQKIIISEMFGVDISQVIEAFEPAVSTEYMPSFFSAYCGSEFSAVFIESDFAIGSLCELG